MKYLYIKSHTASFSYHNCIFCSFLSGMGTVNVDELQTILQSKEAKIRELEEKVRLQNEEIVQLRSHLDKFQSVFPYHNPVSPNPRNNNINLARPRKQRAQGISAEPQSQISIQELSQQTLPSYPKKDRWAHLFVSIICQWLLSTCETTQV